MDNNKLDTDSVEFDLWDHYQKQFRHDDDRFFNPRILRAKEYAGIIHHNCKVNDQDMMEHLSLVYKQFCDSCLMAPLHTFSLKDLLHKYEPFFLSCWLCHVMEKGVTYEELLEHFGPEAAKMVGSINSNGETYEDQLNNLFDKLELEPDGLVIKLCDEYCTVKNLKERDKAAFKEYADNKFFRFKSKLSVLQKDSGLCNKMWVKLERLVYGHTNI